MRQLQLFRWAAALTLAIALAPGAASAQEDDTLTISGTFSPVWLDGNPDPRLVAVWLNGHEHTWTLTLHGATQSHYSFEVDGVELIQSTWIVTGLYDLEFFGPDAAALNGFVSDHVAGYVVWIRLSNHYSYYTDDYSQMYVWVLGDGFVLNFDTSQFASDTLFPTDADGYPVVGPEPFSIETGYTALGYRDWLSWSGGDVIGSLGGLVTFAGSVGEPGPKPDPEPDPEKPAVLAVADASVWEGNKGTTTVAVAVTLSKGSSQAITVSYLTVDGTAKAKEDYTATSGTLTFQPGQTNRTISVSIKGDRKREPNETFFVELSNAVGATIADGSGTVTILNDD